MKNPNYMTKLSVTSSERQKNNYILYFSPDGEKIATDLGNKFSFKIFDARGKMGEVREFLSSFWQDINSIIFISSIAICVRLIKDFITTKDKDPAVIVIDDKKINTIPILSNHLGGAGNLAREISEFLENYLVTTTATDNRGIMGIDVFARENSYKIENLKGIKKVSKAMIEGEKVGFYSICKKVLPYKNLVVYSDLDEVKKSSLQNVIVITDKLLDFQSENIFLMRSKSIILGVGSRKGTKSLDLINLINEELFDLNLSSDSIKMIVSIELKKDEKSIIETARHFKVDFRLEKIEELKKYEDLFLGSSLVKV